MERKKRGKEEEEREKKGMRERERDRWGSYRVGEGGRLKEREREIEREKGE